VVREAAATAAALAGFVAWTEQDGVATALDEPVAAGVRGAKGNQEWLVHLRLADHR
jgi:hypothetical protein